MDNQPSMPAESQQYQQVYQHYQQPQPESTNPNSYDPSTQAYYASYQHYNQTPNQQQPQPQPHVQPDYSSYYYPDYSSSYQSQPPPHPSSIYPPGVTISTEPRQTLVQNHPDVDVYYTHALANPQQQQSQIVYMAPSHSAFPARGGRGGRPVRGGGRGGRGRHGSSRGRGRGRSGGQAGSGIPRQTPHLSSSGPGQAALAAPKKASCEICKVECTNPEILEQHKNGKKHKRNLKVYEEMQSLNKVQVVMQTPHTQGPDSKLEAVQPEKKEGGSVAISEVSNNNIDGADTAVYSADKANSSGVQTPGEREHIGSARGGLKRKMKGGRGGKLMRSSDGLRRRVEPAKPKQVAVLFCELCNVKCESQVVWDSHIAGKKHLSNAKRFPGHQAAMGRGLQALYPRMPDVPSTQFTTQADQQRLPEAQALASTLVNQQGGFQDPQASQAALTQLLSQHGIHDAQSLLTQLIPFFLTQALPNGAAPGTSAQPGGSASGAPGNVAGPVTQDQPNSSTQVAPISSSETESKSETVVGEGVPKTVSSGVADQSNTEKA